MEMESVFYSRVYRANINNYLAIDINGKTKEKGYFISKPLDDPFLELSGSHDFMIISKAIVAYFKDGIDIEKFIKEHNYIYDFCACYKVDAKFTVTWNGKKAQRLNRFYVSQKGAYLYKTKPESKESENMLKGWAVQLANKIEDENALNHNIDYRYYIAKVREIINEFESNQGKLL